MCIDIKLSRERERERGGKRESHSKVTDQRKAGKDGAESRWRFWVSSAYNTAHLSSFQLAEASGLCEEMVYLDVIVVLARQPHGQFMFGLGTPIPQPTHFRRELQVLDGRGGCRSRLATRGGGRRKRKGRGNRKGKRRQSGQSRTGCATSAFNHKRREWRSSALLRGVKLDETNRRQFIQRAEGGLQAV